MARKTDNDSQNLGSTEHTENTDTTATPQTPADDAGHIIDAASIFDTTADDASDAGATAGRRVSARTAHTRRRLIAALVAALVVVAIVVAADLHQRSVSKAAAEGTVVVTVGITGSADEPIWQAVQEELNSENAGITIETKSFEDGTTMNSLTASGELDINAFQHYAYFEDNIAQNNLDLTAIGDTYIMPLNLYSEKYTSPDQFKAGDKVAIPSDLTNSGRALKVLDSAGLIVLDDNTKASPTLLDIASNPSGIEIVPNDAPTIIGLLPDYAGGITNTNHVQDAGWSVDDAIYHEPVDIDDAKYKPYINLISTRTADKDNPTYQQVVKAYHSQRVAQAILDTYQNAVEPAFEY
ncbi:ABC transporter substrate-binding protein [Pseudoscardovia radai]|uniref:ABC transporter substrate-binding protein n=1 Tax=Pseudoscardovia radai TaxID=987066 RepID=A0A261EZU6_9BIFI|nr:MetQ/NlpA family ABC transporter substrate-binding protein [Pseudoscardovia radai]OZG52365.1 ABC transporter substrate-binding protein [Pseudoscardovia radai]